MTAVDDWITELQAGKYSRFPQNLISRIETVIAALQALVAGESTPAGPNGAVQFNNGGSFGGDANFTFSGSSGIGFGLPLFAQNGNGPTILNSAASSIVPTLVPNQSSSNTGLGANGANQISLISAGSEIFRLTSTGLASPNAAGAKLVAGASSATVPTFVPNEGSLTTGIGSQSAGSGSFISTGTEIMRWAISGIRMFSGTITPMSVAGIVGTTTNDNAQAGSIGEFIESHILGGAAVPLAATIPSNITSIALTAGDWDVWGSVYFNGTGVATIWISGINTVSATFPTIGGGLPYQQSGNAMDFGSCGVARISLAAGATVFLVARADFSAGTQGAYGYINARRVR